jgi:predicted transcriptional regulator
MGKLTRLERFMRANTVRPAEVLRKSRKGVSRQHFVRIRYGKMDPTRSMIKVITLAIRRILGRRIKASALFDLGDDPR